VLPCPAELPHLTHHLGMLVLATAIMAIMASMLFERHLTSALPPAGKNCQCHILRASATLVTIPAGTGPAEQQQQQQPTRALLIELVGDRFLRKMVRVLVGSVVREALAQAARLPGDSGALVALAEAGERPATGMPAPATGLCFAGVGYGDMEPPCAP
jgi:hypothetical protein